MIRTSQILATLVAVLLSLSVHADAVWDTPSAKALPEDVAELISGEQYEQAIVELENFIQSEKRNADAWNLLGYSQRKLGLLDESLVSYKKALKLDRKHPGAHEYIGELYLTMGDPKKAKKHLKKLEKYCKDCDELIELAKAIEKYEQGS